MKKSSFFLALALSISLAACGTGDTTGSNLSEGDDFSSHISSANRSEDGQVNSDIGSSAPDASADTAGNKSAPEIENSGIQIEIDGIPGAGQDAQSNNANFENAEDMEGWDINGIHLAHKYVNADQGVVDDNVVAMPFIDAVLVVQVEDTNESDNFLEIYETVMKDGVLSQNGSGNIARIGQVEDYLLFAEDGGRLIIVGGSGNWSDRLNGFRWCIIDNDD